MRYIALLRGINVGGHNKVRMADLKARFEELGFEDVSTYIQSGNVLFTGKSEKISALELRIEAGLEGVCGTGTRVIIRNGKCLAAVLADHPFNGLPDEAKTYVTFLKERYEDLKSGLTPKGDAEILRITEGEVYWIAHPVEGLRGPANPLIETKNRVTTTRNWAVVQKLAELI